MVDDDVADKPRKERLGPQWRSVTKDTHQQLDEAVACSVTCTRAIALPTIAPGLPALLMREVAENASCLLLDGELSELNNSDLGFRADFKTVPGQATVPAYMEAPIDLFTDEYRTVLARSPVEVHGDSSNRLRPGCGQTKLLSWSEDSGSSAATPTNSRCVDAVIHHTASAIY
jgi:hypothetical protein